MNENQNIHEAIEFILASLEKQGQAPGTLKNYINSFHVFERYLDEQGITYVNDEKVCLEYIDVKTGMKITSFNGKTLNPNVNRRMKPLHLLLMYLETGDFQYKPRKMKKSFDCPNGFLEEYVLFEEECRYRGYANATINSNIQKVQSFLRYLDSVPVKSSGEITINYIEDFISTYDTASVKYIGTIFYVLRNYLSFIYEKGFTNYDFSLLLPKIRVMRNA
jgi:integrase/recombinase XerD